MATGHPKNAICRGISVLLLMFVLGLPHGLDPDHIAMIDGMTYRNLEQRAHISAMDPARW